MQIVFKRDGSSETHIDGFERVDIEVGVRLVLPPADIKDGIAPHLLYQSGIKVPLDKVDMLIDSKDGNGDDTPRFKVFSTYTIQGIRGMVAGTYATDNRAFVMNDKGKTTRSL